MQPDSLMSHEELKEIIRTEVTVLHRRLSAEIRMVGKEIIKAVNTRNADGLEIRGPRTAASREQVMAVVAWLANPRHPQNIHHACDMTYRPTENGYAGKEKLYLWCHRNESRIWAWVETYRLNHDIN